jgi:8-oxo-dGTP pyrophosphatase MutT (NUDIX family)
MTTAWIERLQAELAQPLPGLSAQMLMAPSLRRPGEANIPIRDSGVLLLLYPVQNIMCTVFMKRPEYGGPHSGQISFPGGKIESGDTTLVETALRESYEEIGVPPGSVRVLGVLTPLHITVSNFKVLPVVGFSAEKPNFTTDSGEVEYLIEARIDMLVDPGIVKKENLILGDQSLEAPYFDIHGQHIWGATAMILSEFLEVVRRSMEK